MNSKYLLTIIILTPLLSHFFVGPSISQNTKKKKYETRCGWFHNPVPGLIILYDADGEWLLGVPGGYQVDDGDWEWPEFRSNNWVKTNVEHGYGCACFKLRVDYQTHKVLEIKSSRDKPLKACRKDNALKKWSDLFK
ncbi:MAG: DUF4087 domain-containing protein [Candidatus Electrothrix sp. AR1]|nr:DUF4087 domain-containing protein [Candidatus Electrothrix sp. AR1]